MSYTLLDGIPFYTKEEIDDEFSEGSVSEERERAEAAEQANATAISNETDRATAAENALQSQIQDVEGLSEQTAVDLAAEVTRATAAEQANASAITAEITRATNAEQTNANAITAERNRALLAEGNLSTSIIAEASRATAVEQAHNTRITAIEDVIPQAASAQNKLADKAYVEDSIQTASAAFRGSYANVAAIPTDYNDYPADGSGSKKPNDNDYIYVLDASGYQGATLTGTWRFKYTGDWDVDSVAGWLPEYAVNDSVFTQAQLDAINSGIDATKVGKIATNESNIADLQSGVSDIEAVIPSEASAQNKLADSASVNAAIAAADKIFYVTVTYDNSTYTADKTYAEIAAAIAAGKIPIIKYNNTLYYYVTIYNNSYIFNDVHKETDIISNYFSMASNNAITYNTNTLQLKLTAGDGVTISGNVISTKLFPVKVTGSGLADYSYTPSASDIKAAIGSQLPFGYYSNDNIIFFAKNQNAALCAYTFAPSDPTLRGLILEHVSGSGIQQKNYFAIKEFIDNKTGTITVVGSKLIRYYGNNSVAVTLQKDSTYNCSGEVEIYNQLTLATVTISYTNKDGVASTLTLNPKQYAKFIYVHPNDGLYCEHTVPLTGTDDQGNSFAYDVVVRD